MRLQDQIAAVAGAADGWGKTVASRLPDGGAGPAAGFDLACPCPPPNTSIS